MQTLKNAQKRARVAIVRMFEDSAHSPHRPSQTKALADQYNLENLDLFQLYIEKVS